MMLRKKFEFEFEIIGIMVQERKIQPQELDCEPVSHMTDWPKERKDKHLALSKYQNIYPYDFCRYVIFADKGRTPLDSKAVVCSGLKYWAADAAASKPAK